MFESLVTMAPGPELAAALALIDVRAISGHDRVLVTRAYARMASHYAAQAYDAMVAVSDSLPDEIEEFGEEAAAAEIRVALQLTRRAADAEMGMAWELRRRIPRVWELLASGEIDVRRAKTIVHGTSHLPGDVAREVVNQVADTAPRLTSGQLAARLRRLCISADPDDARRRYDDAVAGRRVWSEPTVEGTAQLTGVDLPPDRVAAIMRRINHLAYNLRRDGETRTIEQLRADVYLDLLAGDGTGAGGVVDIRVDLDTLAGLTDTPAELAGYGPVVADIARHITQDQSRAEWRFAVTDPDSGHAIHTGTTGRRPTAAQRRAVETRSPNCVFPGCRMPATQSDLDHRTPWSQGGTTSVEQLDPLCRHDHNIRHNCGWSYQPLPGGRHQWTTTLGHTYTTTGPDP